MDSPQIGIIKDRNTGWWRRFNEEIAKYRIPYILIDFEKDNWQKEVESCSHIISRPNLSHPYLDQSREKLAIIEREMKKPLFPSHSTYWHYDNKNAQYYLNRLHNLKLAKGFVSYDYEDIREYLDRCDYPIVSKASAGAGSKNVRLISDKKQAIRELNYLFNKSIGTRAHKRLLSILKLNALRYSGQSGYMNLQEFIPNNPNDLRITVIGTKYAYAYARMNRKKDFRASGSGMIDYHKKYHRKDALLHCFDVGRRLGFDTMCYDILDIGDDFAMTEFSYTYVDTYLYKAPGIYRLLDGELSFVDGHYWPQELILEYLLRDKWGLVNATS